jgi:hypothetical protein
MDLMTLSGGLAEYRPMINFIELHRPAVERALSQHCKSHTQFQYAMLDNAGPIAGPTKLRNLRQVLAVIAQTDAALQEAWFASREKQCDIDLTEESLAGASGARRNKLTAKADRLRGELSRTESAMAGALRKLAAYYEQYTHLEQQIREELGHDITEADFEADEERFHIMKAFEQALCAARASGGRIDHGNFIYLHDIGINGTLAQADLTEYFSNEANSTTFRTPHQMHEYECAFLRCMAMKYKGCSGEYAKRKGLLAGPSAVATLGIKE